MTNIDKFNLPRDVTHPSAIVTQSPTLGDYTMMNARSKIEDRKMMAEFDDRIGIQADSGPVDQMLVEQILNQALLAGGLK